MYVRGARRIAALTGRTRRREMSGGKNKVEEKRVSIHYKSPDGGSEQRKSDRFENLNCKLVSPNSQTRTKASRIKPNQFLNTLLNQQVPT